MDPIIEEMSHNRPPIRPEVWAHWINYLMVDVQEKLDRLEQLEAVERNSREPVPAAILRQQVKR